eukprot:4738352-Amphidinium_carterae.1
MKTVQDAPLGAKADRLPKKSREKSEDDDSRTILADPDPRDRGGSRTIFSGPLSLDPPRGRDRGRWDDRGGFRTIPSGLDPAGAKDR